MACPCGECRLLHDGVAPHYTLEQRDRCNASPQFLGLYTKKDWDGHEHLYAFKCRSCFQFRMSLVCYATSQWLSVPHLHCDWCKGKSGLYVIADYSVYHELGIDDPPSGWDRFMYEVRMFLKGKPDCSRDGGLHP